MTRSNITVRAALRTDASMIVEFQLAMATETEGLSLDADTVQRGVAAVFDHPERGRYFVAEADGKVVGSLLTIPEWSDWRAGTVLWVHSVYVVPDWRRQGVFRLMYAELRKRVESRVDLKGLRLYVDRRNTPAQAVYESLGMTSEHYVMYEWLK